ncbi:hypothetical protein [Phytoactinopolyspora halotolerans]|uniref:Uncharacterized protein n=1 Tax=Phytoactinopolyspora halotolerans TaxID=1981512 RepID=A0A6L9SAW2_9ACTN|nr:hypothetical protein [Phytoactinopolyspora halotolerans]NEE02287.1 hypothetical protein [Phytoactinopolyspora halotolerans]
MCRIDAERVGQLLGPLSVLSQAFGTVVLADVVDPVAQLGLVECTPNLTAARARRYTILSQATWPACQMQTAGERYVIRLRTGAASRSHSKPREIKGSRTTWVRDIEHTVDRETRPSRTVGDDSTRNQPSNDLEEVLSHDVGRFAFNSRCIYATSQPDEFAPADTLADGRGRMVRAEDDRVDAIHENLPKP